MSSISRKFLLIYPRFAMDLTATKMPTSIDPQESPIMRAEKKSLTLRRGPSDSYAASYI